MNEQAAWAYLSRVAEPPAPALAAFVSEVGPREAAAMVRAGRVGEQVAGETGARREVDRAAQDLAAAAACGARLVTPDHPEWPADALTAFGMADRAGLAPPLALWVRGPATLRELCAHAVAVVGARASTGYGNHVAGELASGLAAHGYTVVSGAAIGIDGAAHRGALAVGGPTLAVLACGIERAYPVAHEQLLARIAAGGLVVSEYPPGTVPAKHRFLVRNRIIAGLAEGTVVVEAGPRSGAHRTASDTASLNRPVMAVPGPVVSGVSDGCHRLIRDGAVLVTRAEEILEEITPIGSHLAERPPPAGRPTDGLDGIASRVHDALPPRAGRDTRWLALEAGVPIGAVRSALVTLERQGFAEHRDGLWHRSTPA